MPRNKIKSIAFVNNAANRFRLTLLKLSMGMANIVLALVKGWGPEEKLTVFANNAVNFSRFRRRKSKMVAGSFSPKPVQGLEKEERIIHFGVAGGRKKIWGLIWGNNAK